MIHTYSLIHDDLPCMDNDDFRRGKPTNHKVFGENNAILAGDGLLNTAYSLCFEEGLKGEKQVRAGHLLCESAGIFGMIAGQSADLYYEKRTDGTEEDLEYIYENKTGKLLIAPALIPSILSNDEWYFELEKFSYYLGLLFQITDDILDETSDFASLGKTVGKDEKELKFTSIRFYGLSGAMVRADMYARSAHAVLDGIDGDTSFLHDLVDYVRNRKN
jgi:geranylgeranyl diphosphate synthase type II